MPSGSSAERQGTADPGERITSGRDHANDGRHGAFLVFAFTSRLTVQPGGRVLAGLREAGLAGAVAGLVIGAVLLLARRGAR